MNVIDCSFWVVNFSNLQNIMIQNSNIRFSYTEKAQYLSNSASASDKLEVGKLVSNFKKGNVVDEDQEQLVSKKSTVLNNDSIKNSKFFSDAKFSRVEKIPFRRSSEKQKYSINQELINKSRQEKIYSSGAIEPLKQLPSLIVKNQRGGRHSQTPKLIQNDSFYEVGRQSNITNHPVKGKSFSISSYDIYKPGFLVSRQELAASRLKGMTEQARKEQSSSFTKAELPQELEEEKPHPPLQINFQNSTDRDLPELNEIESERNDSKIFNKQVEKAIIGPQDDVVPSKNKPQKRLIKEPIVETQIQEIPDIAIKKNSMIEKKVEEPTTPVQKIFERKSKPALQMTVVKTVQTPKIVPQQLEKVCEHQYHQISSIKEEVQVDEMGIHSKQFSEVKKKDIIVKETDFEEKEKEKEKEENLSISKMKSNNDFETQTHLREVERKKEVIIEKKNHQKQDDNIKVSKKVQAYQGFETNLFSTEDYTKIYAILKDIHTCLKAPVLDNHFLLKNVKTYLEIIASGSLDHVEGYSMPLHKLKIIKNALLYERIAVVTISFAYAVGKIKQCLKYLINLIFYASNNTLLILKIVQSCQMETDPSKNPVIAKSDRLIMKRNYDTVRNSNDIILDSIFKISKVEEAFYQSFKDIIKNIGKNSLERTFYNVLEYFSFFLCVSGLHTTIPFLAVAPNPYLRQTIDKRPTLVIDIVEVFCHGTRKSKSHIFRPHTQYFLSQMSQYYELISFTCAYPNQIDKVIDILDPKNNIKHRLYRHHAQTRHNILFKDLERLGRDLHKMILLDSEANVIQGQSLNTIKIPVWRGNKNDTILAELCPILATIAVKGMDCLEAAKKINEQQQKNQEAGIKYLNFGISLQ